MSVCDNCGVDSNLMLVVKLKDESFHYFLSSKRSYELCFVVDKIMRAF